MPPRQRWLEAYFTFVWWSLLGLSGLAIAAVIFGMAKVASVLVMIDLGLLFLFLRLEEKLKGL